MELLARVLAGIVLVYVAIVGLQLTFGGFSPGHSLIGLVVLVGVAAGFACIRWRGRAPAAQ